MRFYHATQCLAHSTCSVNISDGTNEGAEALHRSPPGVRRSVLWTACLGPSLFLSHAAALVDTWLPRGAQLFCFPGSPAELSVSSRHVMWETATTIAS